MSVHNSRGLPYAILNEGGYYDLYDANGIKMELPMFQIRLTQHVNELDRMIIICPVNIVRNIDEMHKVLNP